MTRLPGHLWPIAAALAAGLMLAIAHAFQTFGGYAPCELCLRQRDVYWLTLAAAGLLALVVPRRPRLARAAAALIGLLFLAESGVAIYHAGVEWKFWPGPEACTAAHVGRLRPEDMRALLAGAAQRERVVQCDVAALRVLGLSMAGWNALAALALAVLSGRVAQKGSLP